jgi:hypothetical protein
MIAAEFISSYGAEVSALCFLSFLFIALINDGRS